MTTDNANPEEMLARFEELTALESECEDVELELLRKSDALYAPLWQKRAEVIAKIPYFWTLVFEQAPPELDNFIQPSDQKVFVESLQSLDVTRFEINDPKGSPRSVAITFGFADNEWFEDKVLEKKFWFRRTRGWEGLVSEPVKIHWKKGKDLTGSLTDAACALAEAKRKLAESSAGAGKSKDETTLPEYKSMVAKIGDQNSASASFFTWFGFVSSYRYVGAQESEEAEKVHRERMEKIKRGEKVEEDEDDEDDDERDYQEVEAFPLGDEIATLIADDLWPSAIKYYKQTHEGYDEELSEISVEDMDEDENSGDEIDIRGLVGKGSKAKDASPPSKKQRRS